MPVCALILVLAMVPGHRAVAASDFELVADANRDPIPGSSNPSGFVRMGDAWFFIASTPHEGARVWRSDLTAGGTIPITTPYESNGAGGLVVLGEHLYYVTYFGFDNQLSFEVWRTDGRPGGATRVAALEGRTGPLVAFAGWLWFPAHLDIDRILRLWRTDGTRVELVLESAGVSDLLENLFAVLETQMLFNWYGDAAGYELWRTDGTIAGTDRVADLNPGGDDSGIYPGVSGVLGDTLIFSAYSDGPGYRLFASDGTSDGTRPLVELDRTTPVGVGGDHAYFEKDGALWATDGTAQGTRVVGTGEFSSISSLTPFADDMFFLGHQSNQWGLWSHDERGDQLVLDLPPILQGFDIESSSSLLAAVFVDQERPTLHYRDNRSAQTITFGPSARGGVNSLSVIDDLVFLDVEDSAGREPWVSDGTAAGTRRIANLARDDGSLGSSPERLTWVDDTLFFGAGRETWRWNDAGGAVLIHERQSSRVSRPKIASFGGSAYFADGSTLYSASPTSPKKVHWRPPLASQSQIGGILSTGDRLFFTLGGSLYIATETGATYVGEFTNRGESGVAHYNNQLFFAHDDGVAGEEVWTTDGTVGGTEMLLDASSGPRGSSPRGLCATQPGVFFGTVDGDEWTLWVSDGSQSGTHPVVEVVLERMPPPFDSELKQAPYVFAAAEDGVYFFINDTLWWSDGTRTGTAPVRRFDEPTSFDWTSIDSDYGPRVAAAFLTDRRGQDGRPLLLFGRSSGGFELWASDGSEAGTKRIRAFDGGGFPPSLVTDGAEAFFVASDERLGDEIWRTDGTPAGTLPLGEFRPGRATGQIHRLTIRGDHLYFVGDDGVTGSEIWRGFIGETGCSGDCDSDGRVTISELITAVRIALGRAPTAACSAADRNANSEVSIGEVIAAVGSALSGC